MGEFGVTCPKEQIPVAEVLFRWAFAGAWRKKNGTIGKGAFEDPELSADWQRHAKTPEACRDRVVQTKGFHPDCIAVVQFEVDHLRDTLKVRVDHDPEPDWCAHSIVTSTAETDPELLVKLARIANTGPNPSLKWSLTMDECKLLPKNPPPVQR